MRLLQVVFIESERDLIMPMQGHYEKLFARAGYTASMFGVSTEQEAKKTIEDKWPHVVICDMSFGGTNNGLIIMRNIKKEYPDLYLICASKAEYSPRDVIAKGADFEQYLDKGSLVAGDDSYIDHAVKLFRLRFKTNTSFRIDETGYSLADDFKSKADQREFRSLVGQLTFVDHEPDEQLTPDIARVTPLTGGLSGSIVYRFDAINAASGIPSVPAVLKVSDRRWAELEIRNYNRFVKWGLPYMWRVDLLGTGFTKRYGAIGYSFVLSGATKFSSLTTCLREKDIPRIKATIDRIFSPDMRRWYGEELLRPEENINNRYSSRYFRGSDSKNISNRKFQSVVSEIFGSNFTSTNFNVGANKYPKPIERLFGVPNGAFISCICHGDLNTNNVIVAENGQVIFIDFQETGRGHVFEDFVTMESHVRLHFPEDPIDKWVDYLNQEALLGTGDDLGPLDQSHRLMAEIRVMARKNFPRENFQNYYYAVAAYNFRLLRASLAGDQARRTCCAIIAALRYLEL